MVYSEEVFKTQEEYLSFVNKYAELLGKEMDMWEKQVDDDKDLHDIAWRLPGLISAVNVMGYFRGQDNMFLGNRPHTDHQKDLYKLEDEFEARLWRLVKMVKDSEESEYYFQRLNEYYIDARGGRKD